MPRSILRSILPIFTGTPSATQQTYCLNIVQKLCRQICLDSFTPIISTLNFKYLGFNTISANYYVLKIKIFGTVNYRSYKNNCCQGQSESIELDIELPVYSINGTLPITVVLTSGTPANVAVQTQECCSLTDVIKVLDYVTVNTTFAPKPINEI